VKLEWREDGITHRLEFPEPVEHNELCTLGYWLKRSPIPGTPRWEWVVTNISVTLMPGMSSGYCATKWGARRELRRALRWWHSLGYSTEGPR
jgi:hypothetical protein